MPASWSLVIICRAPDSVIAVTRSAPNSGVSRERMTCWYCESVDGFQPERYSSIH
jgi:hypothetical protein